MDKIQKYITDLKAYDAKYEAELQLAYDNLWRDFNDGEINLAQLKPFMDGLFREVQSYSNNKTEIFGETISELVEQSVK